MTIQDLKNLALQCLQALSPVEPERLRERVLVTHTQRVINKLLDILAKAEIAPDHVLADLEKLLAQNWQDTQRTMLCYTAIPESDMTRLFIKTAEFVAQSRNSKPQNPEDSSRRPTGVIELLMPGVCTESLSPSYPDLGPYQDLAADKTLLWKNPEVDIQKLLVSHVLGTGSYLIPVQLLTELEANGQVRLDNPYFDYKGHAAKHSTLQPAELERLYHHSPETRALKEAYDTCKALMEDKSTLLDHLFHLCNKLHLNSAAMRGQEENAGSGAYPAIIAFNDYYTNLAENEKMRIPQEVRTEIDKLLALSSDKKQNSHATTNINTCIAIRRGQILATVRKHQPSLQNIAVTDERKKELGIAAKGRVIQCRDALKTRIETGSYSGNDSFGITRELLQRLEIKLFIASMSDLRDFLSLEPEEITALGGQDEELQRQLASQVKTLEDWVMLAIDTPLQKLGALMGLISGHLAKAFIKKPSDISALLMPLSAERINVVLGAMKEKLSEIIQNATGFKQMLQPLTPEQRTSIYLAIVDKLPELIRRPADLGLALQYLSPGQGTDVCRAMQEQEKLSEIFKYPTDLGLALQYLTPEQFTAVCSAMQEKLPQMIRGAGGLQYVFQHLTPEQSAAVCSAVREKLSGMIKNAGDFAMLLTYLSPEQRSGIYLAMKNKLPDIIKNPSELTSFLARTNVEIQQHFFESGSADDLLAKIMLNVHKDIPECHQKLLSNEVKNAFNKSCFSGLLLNLKRNAGNLHNKNTYNSFLKIIDQLDQESSQYFNAYPQNQEELEIFQRNCNTSINLVKNILRYHESLGTSLGKKLLSVVSFSLNTLASITKSTQTTGVYQCRFFDTPGEQAADNVSGLLNLLPKPKP